MLLLDIHYTPRYYYNRNWKYMLLLDIHYIPRYYYNRNWKFLFHETPTWTCLTRIWDTNGPRQEEPSWEQLPHSTEGIYDRIRQVPHQWCDSTVSLYTYTHTHTHTHGLHQYILTLLQWICVCVCVCTSDVLEHKWRASLKLHYC